MLKWWSHEFGCSFFWSLSWIMMYFFLTSVILKYFFCCLLRLVFSDVECNFLFYRATQIKTYSWDNAQVILVGNKCDLEDERLVPTEDGQRLAEELGMRSSIFDISLLKYCFRVPFSVFSQSTCSEVVFLWTSGFQFFEASAKDNINVKQVFERLVDIICDKMNESMEGDGNFLSNQGKQSLKDSPSESSGGCAC